MLKEINKLIITAITIKPCREPDITIATMDMVEPKKAMNL